MKDGLADQFKERMRREREVEDSEAARQEVVARAAERRGLEAELATAMSSRKARAGRRLGGVPFGAHVLQQKLAAAQAEEENARARLHQALDAEQERRAGL